MNIVSLCIISFSLGMLVCNLMWVVVLDRDERKGRK